MIVLGSTLLEPFLEDSLAMPLIDLLLIAYMVRQTAMGMAIRCLPTSRITHHALPMQVMEAMIRDTTVGHHLEHSSILKPNTKIPTTLRIDLILNIMKEILVTRTISRPVIRMVGLLIPRDQLHQLHQGSIQVPIQLVITTIRVTNKRGRLVIKALMPGFHRPRTWAGDMVVLSNLETHTLDWTEEEIGDHLRPSTAASRRVSCLYNIIVVL